ncbi:MAG: IS110 family transposase [Coleofasciculaceae cyanobacterium SM2_3_26]|nr:IS110 family transposase [Coleofasciculaceae cyanobacterium SM2_3_26]
MADWLIACGVTTVAMESTGVYWTALYQVLESKGLEVVLANPQHLKRVPGRKSDVSDCQWLQQLHSYGLVAGSFRPEESVCVLRSYVRQRERLVQSAAQHIQRMQKALDQMNLRLHRVVHDITGKSGMAILQAIVAGERDPDKLAALACSGVKSTQSQMVEALRGNYRQEHLFVLGQELALYEFLREQIKVCEAQIEAYLEELTDKQPPSPPDPQPPTDKQQKPPTKLRSKLLERLYRISGVNFAAIPGLGEKTVQVILSEVGFDPGRFENSKQFCSWLGLAPHRDISGGKVLKTRTRRTKNRAACSFRLAAQAAGRSKGAFGAHYRQLRARLGAPKAITAMAHKIARLFYHLWQTGEAYEEMGVDAYEQQQREHALDKLRKQAHRLGQELVPKSELNPVS